MVDKLTDRGIHANDIVKDLKKRNIIMDESFRPKVKGKKHTCYRLKKRSATTTITTENGTGKLI